MIIDDGSMDDTTDVAVDVTAWHNNVFYHKFEERQGVAKAKNKGIELADPDNHIHILDDDDVLYPNFYERLLAEIGDNDVIFCPFYVVKEVLRPDGMLEVSREEMQDWKGFVPGKQKERPYISMVCSLFRPGFFKDYGPFMEDMKFCIEWPILLRAELKGAKFKFLDEILGEIRWRWGPFSDNLGFNKSPAHLRDLRPRIDEVISEALSGNIATQ
jgi:glycosyltransferase involved in cell wall biosynthesis